MRKKIFSIILVLMILPLSMILSACKKTKSYNLSNLTTDFNKIEEISENVNIDEGVVYFDFSTYSYNDNFYFNAEINKSSSAYASIKNYNQLFENSMYFSKLHLANCSGKNVKASDSAKNRVNNCLNDLKDNILNVSKKIDSLASVMEFNLKTGENLDNIVCLNALESLYKSYGNLIRSSSNFNKALSDLYFDHILSISKTDFSKVGIDEIDVTKAVVNIQARIDLQVVNLTELYTEMYVLGNAVAESLTTKKDDVYQSFGNEYVEYSMLVNAIKNKSVSLDAVSFIEANKKVEFYNKNMELYNIQCAMKNDYQKYSLATNNIYYQDVVTNNNSTHIEKTYADSISSFYYLAKEYNSSLIEMFSILGM